MRNFRDQSTKIGTGPNDGCNTGRRNLSGLVGATRRAQDMPTLRDQPRGQGLRTIPVTNGKKRLVHDSAHVQRQLDPLVRWHQIVHLGDMFRQAMTEKVVILQDMGTRSGT